MTDQIIPCLLLSFGEKKVILPTAAIAEIIPFEKPELVIDTPSWFIGMLTWRGIHIPLVNMQEIQPFSTWHEETSEGSLQNQKNVYIAILNRFQKISENSGLDPERQYPFFSILINGVPKLYRLSVGKIKFVSRDESEGTPFLMEVKIQNNQAFIPNLQYFWGIIDELPLRLQSFK